MDEIKFPERLIKLGTMLNDPDTVLGDLANAAMESGMAIQYRIVPFSDVLHVLNAGLPDGNE